MISDELFFKLAVITVAIGWVATLLRESVVKKFKAIGIKRYRKGDEIVEAVRLTYYSDFAGILWWLDRKFGLIINGELCQFGDYIVKYKNGHVALYKPDVFHKTYEWVKK